jgi:hypothetical protein
VGANHSAGEKLQTFGLEEGLLLRIDAVRRPRHKTRASFFRAAAMDLLERMEAAGGGPRGRYPAHTAQLSRAEESASSDAAPRAAVDKLEADTLLKIRKGRRH